MLGKLQLVKSVTPLEVGKREDEQSLADCIPSSDKSSEEGDFGLQSDATVRKKCQSETSNPPPDVDLGGLTEDQKIAVVNMLKEEADSFLKDDDDVGCAEGLLKNSKLTCLRIVQSRKTIQLFQSLCIQK